MHKVGIITFDGFTDLDLFLPWDLLNRVTTLLGRKDWQVEIVSDSKVVTSKSGLLITPTTNLAALNQMSAVLIGSGPKVKELVFDAAYLDQIQINPKNQLLAGLCSGALLLAAKGFLKGEEATTYPTSVRLLKELGAMPASKSFVKNGNIATSASCLAGVETCRWIISELLDSHIADKVISSVKPIN